MADGNRFAREETPIIDAHLHMGEDCDGSSVDEQELIRVMDENRIEKALVFPLNEKNHDENFLSTNQRNLDLQRARPERVLCGFRVDPNHNFQKTLDFAEREKIRVMKLHPTAQGFKLSSPAFRNLLDELASRNYKPLVYLHTDIIPVEGTRCQDLNCPRDVIKTARRYPDFAFVMAHCGRWCESTEKGIAQVGNVYIDTSIAPLFLIRKYLSILGADRILYGSDYPYSHPRIEQEKIFLLGLSPRDTEAVLAGNFRKLLA